MPKKVTRADCHFQMALGYLLKYWNMGLPDAMKLADFSAQEQACRAKRMCLHRLWKKATNGSKNDGNLMPLLQVVDLSATEGLRSVERWLRCSFSASNVAKEGGRGVDLCAEHSRTTGAASYRAWARRVIPCIQ